MRRYEQDPQNVHRDLNQCEIGSLKHVDPDAHVEEEVFYYSNRSKKPTMEEYSAAQPKSGHPTGLKFLRSHDEPDVIQAYTDILGSLMQASESPPMDNFHARDSHSFMTINVLTMNHGNLARNPKSDGRELKNMPMRDRPITRMLLRNNAHIICLNEADAFVRFSLDI